MFLQREPRPSAFAVQCDGQQDQGRFYPRVRLVRTSPDQETERDEKGVGATFLHRVAGASIQLNQASFQFLIFQPDEDLTALQGVFCMRFAKIFKASGFVQLLATRILALHQCWAWQQLDGLPFCQGIFQFWCCHVEQQRLLALLEVQQRVS